MILSLSVVSFDGVENFSSKIAESLFLNTKWEILVVNFLKVETGDGGG